MRILRRLGAWRGTRVITLALDADQIFEGLVVPLQVGVPEAASVAHRPADVEALPEARALPACGVKQNNYSQ